MYDATIIGSGPGGYVAAIRVSQLGGRACIIEKDRLGGSCLHKGCIPTKALIESSSLFAKIKDASEFGIEVSKATVNLKKMVSRKNDIVQKLSEGVEYLLKSNRVDILYGKGIIENPKSVAVVKSDGTAQIAETRNIILATGSEPAKIPSLPIDGKRIITSDEAIFLEQIPKSVIIVGGGVIGCEFASLFNALGCEVAIVEMLPSILTTEDEQVVKHMQAFLKRKGVKLHLKKRIGSVTTAKSEDLLKAKLDSGEEVAAELMLVAVGRSAVSAGIGLEKVGVKVERGKILVDERMRTSVANIYAVGDVASRYLLAHVASAEGKIAASNCMNQETQIDYSTIPNCIFTAPEIAHVGLTEAEAKREGYELKVGRFPFAASGKALCIGETEGFVKVISDAESSEVLGVHIIGPQATEIIHEACLALKLGATAKDLAHTIHAHPTLSEALMEASEAAYWKAVHIV